MKKFIFSCLLATISISAFADNINWMETTYLTKEIVGSWSAIGATNTPCYNCKIKEKMFSFTVGANIAPTALRKAGKVHLLQINTSEKQSIKVFKRKRANNDSYVIQLGNELFYFEEDAKNIPRCTTAFLTDATELQHASKKHGFLIATGNVLVIYD